MTATRSKPRSTAVKNATTTRPPSTRVRAEQGVVHRGAGRDPEPHDVLGAGVGAVAAAHPDRQGEGEEEANLQGVRDARRVERAEEGIADDGAGLRLRDGLHERYLP